MKYHIFDLDHTVIDSSHRQRLLPNGDLDLDHWIANRADRDLVMADRLLPFASYWHTVQKVAPVAPAICTSRVVSMLEFEFLAKHGFRYSHFIHRADGDMRSDAPYKVAQIRDLLDRTGWEAQKTTLYDDHPGVREAVAKELGVLTFNPVPFNTKAKRFNHLHTN